MAYVENVPEGADSEQVFRSLSRKGFNLIFGTSFGFIEYRDRDRRRRVPQHHVHPHQWLQVELEELR